MPSRCCGPGGATTRASARRSANSSPRICGTRADPLHVRRAPALEARPCSLAAVALLFAALAEPQVGFRWEQVKRRGNDIVFAVDTSRSMLTPDVKPDRLTRAKLAIDDFVEPPGRRCRGPRGVCGKRLPAVSADARLWRVPRVAGRARYAHHSARRDRYQQRHPGGAIALCAIAPGSDKILILVTDGEDLEGDALDTAKAAAKQDGLKIYTVGVGTANGDLIPLPADQGGGFLKDDEGRFVRSRLDEPALKALAQATGGSYAPLGASNQGLEVIYAQALAPLAKHDLESRTEKVYIERYQWPLAALSGLSAVEPPGGHAPPCAVARHDGGRRGLLGRPPRRSSGRRDDAGVRRVRTAVGRRRRPRARLARQRGIGLSARRFLRRAARLFGSRGPRSVAAGAEIRRGHRGL